MERVRAQNPHQDEFHQAVHEVLASVLPMLEETPRWREAAVLPRLLLPDREIAFRVPWRDDGGRIHVHRGWRIQWSNALGPYKGGLRFHPTVTPSVLRFLAFEQVIKNSLTGLPLGGAKGGSDFDPRGRSDLEIRRFCASFMAELHRHIGEDVDVPAGDIGVGEREIGYLFGDYVRIRNRWAGVLTGKTTGWGGSEVRVQATGWGLLYFVEAMLAERDESLEGKRVAVSGSGNVALYAAQKAVAMGGRVVTLSDSDGTVHLPEGLDEARWEEARALKEDEGGRVSELAERWGCAYLEGESPWGVECDVALPCATQNELDRAAAASLVEGGVLAVAEGANMPCTPDAVARFREAGTLFAPGKASNAGGVAVSGLEMSQNSRRRSWEAERVDEELRGIMRGIHARCMAEGERGDGVDYVDGANRAGFARVADALASHGVP